MTLDFDAEHPVLRWLIVRDSIPDEAAVWLSFLYMAFYDEASAWVTFRASDPFTVPADVALPIGTNRRNLFGSRIRTHFESLAAERRTAREWPRHDFTGDPAGDWDRLRASLGRVWGNGRFGVYTTAEMLQKVNDFPVEVTGFDNKGSSAPADGLRRLYGLDRDAPLAELDCRAEEAAGWVRALGCRPNYTAVDRGVVESVLCNYSATCRGRFYSGRNVDRQQGRILRVEAMGHDLTDIWDARAAVLRRADLGEFGGWVGIDKTRLTHYKRTGEMLWSPEKR
jgi:hypothetical protein